MIGHKERGTWGRLWQPWRLDAAAAASRGGRRPPGWASWAGQRDGGRVVAWAERPSRPVGRWAEFARSEGKFFSE
jgi:hypothetical protein